MVGVSSLHDARRCGRIRDGVDLIGSAHIRGRRCAGAGINRGRGTAKSVIAGFHFYPGSIRR